MTRQRIVVGLWVSILGVILVSSQAATSPSFTRSPADSLAQRRVSLSQQQKQQKAALYEGTNNLNTEINNFATSQSSSLSRLLIDLRGGASDDDDEISMDTSSSGAILTKVQNIIRSVLKIGDKKAPGLASALRTVLKSLEDVLGVELLPARKSKKSKKKKSKKVEASKDSEDEKEDQGESVKSKKKAKATKATAVSKKPTATTAKHLNQKLTSKNPNYRIQKELKAFIKDPPPNLSVKVGKNIRIWIVTMAGAENSIYEGDVFKLRISFPPTYPTMPPSVYFLPPNIP